MLQFLVEETVDSSPPSLSIPDAMLSSILGKEVILYGESVVKVIHEFLGET